MRFKSKMILLAMDMLLVAGAAFNALAAPRRIPIVLDTDIGSDIDDAFALALVLKSPELELRAVTTVSGDTQARARLAAKMLWDAGRKDVPVAAGEPGKKIDISQAAWGDGFSSPSLVSESAVNLLKREVDRGHGEMVLVAIGPLTNVAAFLQRYPEEKKKIKQIVLMGGSIARGYYPNSGPTAEYNIATDAPAAQVVFTAGIPILMAPLDVTARLQVDESHLQRLFALSTPLAQDLRSLYLLWKQPTPTLHDPMAVSLLLDPSLCAIKPLAIRVDDRGMTIAEDGKPANARVAVETDPARFIDFYMHRVAR